MQFMRLFHAPAAIILLIFSLSGATHASAEPSLTFFSELDAAKLNELTSSRAVISDLKALNASVSVGLIDLSPKRADAIKNLNDAGIPVIAWILVEKSDGYWANLRNVAAVKKRFEEFKKWTADHNLRFSRVAFDIEPDIRTMDGGMTGIASIILNGIISSGATLPSVSAMNSAETSYARIFDDARDSGWPVDTYLIPVIADERMAGSNMIRRSMGLVDVPSDREIPMLYSTVIPKVGSGFLQSYASSEFWATGKVDAIAIGVTGGGVSVGAATPNMTWSDFTNDLLVASSYTDQIHVFSLEGCVAQGWVNALRRFDWNASPESSYLQTLTVGAARAALNAGLRVSPTE